MADSASALARWLPTLLGASLALGTVALYELGVVGSPEIDDCACDQTREPPPPRTSAPTTASPAERPHPGHATEREALVEQVEKLETQTKLLAEQNAAGEVRYHGHSQAELEAMARNCDVRADYPTLLDPQAAEDLALTSDEQDAYRRALERFAEQENQLHRELLRELSPDLDVDALDTAEVRKRLVRQLGRSKRKEDADIRRQIAEERAGMREPPDEASLADSSVFARYTRARFEAGNRFSRLLEQELGAERTQELRSVFDGWKGARLRESECPEPR